MVMLHVYMLPLWWKYN